MKHTKQNIIKLLEAMSRDKFEIYQLTNDEIYLNECMALDVAIDILKDKSQFDVYANIYKYVIK